MTPKLNQVEWLTLGFALVVATGAFVHQMWYPSALYDAGQYAEMGRHIVDHGIYSRFMESQVRTYGYPAFLSVVYRLADAVGVSPAGLLFVVQAGLYILAAMLLRRSLAHWSVSVARSAFCGLLINYYALIYAPECLTESLSLGALILLSSGWLDAYRLRAPLWLLAPLGLLAGFAVMIRPANLFMTIAWLAGIALICFRSRHSTLRLSAAAAVVATCVTLPFLPQLVYNGVQFGRWTPLLARDLGTRQQAWGIQYIKYATAMPPIPQAAVHYVNPWLAGTQLNEDAPLNWYLDNPGRGALTLAIHSFNLIDQDLLFTYSRDLAPWYRVPLGVLNHAAVGLGLIGLITCVGNCMRRRSQTTTDAVGLLVVTLAGAWAIHVWTAVEMRFGLPLLAGLFPTAVYMAVSLRRSNRPRAVTATCAVVALYVAGALQLSGWVRAQSPSIEATLSSTTQFMVAPNRSANRATDVRSSVSFRQERHLTTGAFVRAVRRSCSTT